MSLLFIYFLYLFFVEDNDKVPPRPPLPKNIHPLRPSMPPTIEEDDENENEFPIPQPNQPILVNIKLNYFL